MLTYTSLAVYLKSSVYAELFGVPGGNRKERSDGIARSSHVKAVLYDERHADETAGNDIKRALCNAHSACKLAFPAGATC